MNQVELRIAQALRDNDLTDNPYGLSATEVHEALVTVDYTRSIEAVSYTLSDMTRAGLVGERKRGHRRKRHYRLAEHGLAALASRNLT